MRLFEIERPYRWGDFPSQFPDAVRAEFDVEDDRYQVIFAGSDDVARYFWPVDEAGRANPPTGEKRNVLDTVYAITADYLRRYRPKRIWWIASGGPEGGLARAHRRLIEEWRDRFAEIGYKVVEDQGSFEIIPT